MTEEILARIIGLSFLIISFTFLINKNALKVLVRLFRSKEFLVITGSAFVVSGITIISLHNVWEISWSLLITVSGWLLLVEGLYRLLFIELTVEMIKDIDSLLPIKISLLFTLILGVSLTLISFLS